MAATDKEVHTLHRYLIWSLHMREQLNAIENVPKKIIEKKLWLIRPFMYLSLWLALLFVVIEGYQELGLSDPVIDPMLASPNVDLLRRLRNGAFHYQRDYFDRRFMDVFSSGEVGEWATRLHKEFRRFFFDWFRAKGLEIEIVENSEV